MKKLLITLFFILAFIVKTNAEYVGTYLEGEKPLYPLSYIDSSFPTNKYVHVTPVSQILFMFQSPDKDYVIANLPAEKVHFVFDSTNDCPTVRFRWTSNDTIGSGDFASISCRIIYAKISLKKKEVQLEKPE
jgi:hypothetical protein